MPTNRKISDFGNQSILLDTDLFPLVDPTEGVADDKNKSATWLTIKNSIPSGNVTIKNTLWVDNTATPDTGVRDTINKPFDTIQKAFDVYQNGDTIFILYTGTDYIGNFSLTTLSNENVRIMGIGGQMPSLRSTSGITLDVNVGDFHIEGLKIYSTSASTSDSPISTATNSVLQSCNIYAHGNTSCTATSYSANDCYYESAGTSTLIKGLGNTVYNRCYFKQPYTDFILAIDNFDIQNRNELNNCIVEGGRNGIACVNATGGRIILRDTLCFDQKNYNVYTGSTGRNVDIRDSIFENNATFPNIRCGWQFSRQSSVINCRMTNTSTATTAIDIAGVGVGNMLVADGNFHTQTNTSSNPAQTIGTSTQDANVEIYINKQFAILEYNRFVNR